MVSQNIVKIAMVGKYTGLSDSYISVLKSLQHACLEVGWKLEVVWLEASNIEEATRTTDEDKYNAAWATLKTADVSWHWLLHMLNLYWFLLRFPTNIWNQFHHPISELSTVSPQFTDFRPSFRNPLKTERTYPQGLRLTCATSPVTSHQTGTWHPCVHTHNT